MVNNGMRSIYPGEIPREDFLKPLGSLALALQVPTTRSHGIVKECRIIMPDTALRLACYFGGDARSWLNLQTEFDLSRPLKRMARTINDLAASCGVFGGIHTGSGHYHRHS